MKFLQKIAFSSFIILMCISSTSRAGSTQFSPTEIWKNLVITQLVLTRISTNTKFGIVTVDERLGTTSINDVYWETPVGPMTANGITISNLTGLELGSSHIGGQLNFHELRYQMNAHKIPKTVFAAFNKLNLLELIGDLTVEFKYDIGQSKLDLSAFIAVRDIGNLSVDSSLTDVHFSADPVRLASGRSSRAEFKAKLKSFSGIFKDNGITKDLINYVAAERGETPEEQSRLLVNNLGKFLEDILVQGGSSPEQTASTDKFISEGKKSFEGFLSKPGYFQVTANPKEPVYIDEIEERLLLLGDLDYFDLRVTNSRNPVSAASVISEADIKPLTSSLEGSRELGRRYLEGNGVPQNFKRAMEVLGKYKGMDDPAITYLIAKIHHQGLGVKRNSEDAYHIALVSAGLGNVQAAKLLTDIEQSLTAEFISSAQDNALGTWQRSTHGVDLKKHRSLAFKGDIEAMRTLARNYFNGIKLPRHYIRAYAWASVGAAAGDRLSRSLRDSLLNARAKVALEPAQLDEAQSLAANLWLSVSGVLINGK